MADESISTEELKAALAALKRRPQACAGILATWHAQTKTNFRFSDWTKTDRQNRDVFDWEFFALHYRPERADVILNPPAYRSERWK